jgi:dTDP-4-dehydrorhamnose reductase
MLVGQWIAALHKGKSVTAFSDLHFCPISQDYAVEAIFAITEAGLPGIFHVSGAADLSYHRAALHFAKRMGLDESRIIEERAEDRGIPREEIATFTSLDASRYTALTGKLPPQPFEVLDAVYGSALADDVVLQ